MHPYTEKISAYLAEREPNYGDGDIHTLLEMLYHCYTELNPIDSEKIRRDFAGLDTILSKLPWEDNNALFCAILDLCGEHEALAFFAGFDAGARLMAELDDRGIL